MERIKHAFISVSKDAKKPLAYVMSVAWEYFADRGRIRDAHVLTGYHAAYFDAGF